MKARLWFWPIALAMTALIVRTAVAGGNRAVASWYGPGLFGRHTACGQTLEPSTWGVAHKWLRCGTPLRLCYRGCVTARVIDRGPYVAGRDFDLTYPVKRAIGMPGVATISWRVAR